MVMGIEVEQQQSQVRVVGANYIWQWSAADDHLQLLDQQGRTIAAGALQPAVVVTTKTGDNRCGSGRVGAHEVDGHCLTIRYEEVNGNARMVLRWRFEEESAWLEPVVYETDTGEDIVSLHYFAAGTPNGPRPTLFSSEHVIPGINMSGSIGPIVSAHARLHGTANLGAAAQFSPGWGFQWGLPVHFFAGFNRQTRVGAAHGLTRDLSDAFCLGLASLPVGDLWLDFNRGYISPRINIRGDLWGHRCGPGTFTLGAEWVVTIASSYREAIAKYYRTLLQAGIVRPVMATGSEHQHETALMPQFNTWGAQCARDLLPWQFNEEILDAIYDEFRESGMQAGMFVIDDKWEGVYGGLAHDPERFPNFESFLERVRADGYRLGLWAALLRCQDPEALGLTTGHMLRNVDGSPLVIGSNAAHYFIFDVTQPKVAKVLSGVAKRFIRRYRPDLVKFDFGYELPVLSTAAPRDMEWSGERLLQKGLDVIIGAMKEENPDLVVMYYGLSPLLADYYDLHSPDDLYLAIGDYDLEANRRFYFSSLCGEFGMPTYGSSGYDWATSPSIWFDSAAIGTVGSLNSFTGDEIGGLPSPAILAKYNGVAQAIRSTTTFHVEPLDETRMNAARGATAGSWVRREGDQPTLVALRDRRWDGAPGAGHFQDLVSTDASVIVASQNADGLATTAELAIVPFGTGTLTLQHSGPATSAIVTEHSWGGDTYEYQVALQNGQLHLPIREEDESGRPVEWLRVIMTDA